MGIEKLDVIAIRKSVQYRPRQHRYVVTVRVPQLCNAPVLTTFEKLESIKTFRIISYVLRKDTVVLQIGCSELRIGLKGLADTIA